MNNLHSQDQIDAMRKRLYQRGATNSKPVRHKLSDTPVEVSKTWVPDSSNEGNTNDLRSGIDAAGGNEQSSEEKPKRHYRSFILLGSLLIFIFVVGLSSLFLYFGGNKISNDNIYISVLGPSAIGGGEVVPLQVAVSNENSVVMESVTLILKYPTGTRSVGDSPRNLFEERVPIDDIAPGEVQNIPVKVAIFGEEHAEKSIEATVEYRINGSNGMFYKNAEAFALRISSSPLVLRIESIEKVASGQLVEIVMTAVSNASSPLHDVLIEASYPNGFTYETSEPTPVYGQNVWRIEELLPEQTAVIKLQGIVSGLTEETFRINFNAGPSSPDNQNSVGATLAEAKADFIIERPFIDVAIDINGDTDRKVIIGQDEVSSVRVDITNTLDETVYDMVVEIIPNGNALAENSIKSSSGFYDSNNETVRWEVSNNSTFDRILPGGSRSLEFAVHQGPELTTASFDMVVNVYARRVAESSAQETLIGTIRAEAKYSSTVGVGSQASLVSGPVPPQVGEETVYNLSLGVSAGANDLANTIVETSLPLHVTWLDSYETEGVVTYNSVSKKIQWASGDISSGQRKDLSFQVSILPSTSQVGQVVTLLNRQQVRANDRFTNALLQDGDEAVTTELSEEMGHEIDNGVVIR